MKILKSALVIFVLGLVANGTLVAQEQSPGIYLDTFEKCNNYARHFCMNGSHEAAVNRELLDMKRKGYRITPKVIRNVAKSTPSRLRNPLSAGTQ